MTAMTTAAAIITFTTTNSSSSGDDGDRAHPAEQRRSAVRDAELTLFFE
jgi:hypothetical protein